MKINNFQGELSDSSAKMKHWTWAHILIQDVPHLDNWANTRALLRDAKKRGKPCLGAKGVILHSGPQLSENESVVKEKHMCGKAMKSSILILKTRRQWMRTEKVACCARKVPNMLRSNMLLRARLPTYAQISVHMFKADHRHMNRKTVDNTIYAWSNERRGLALDKDVSTPDSGVQSWRELEWFDAISYTWRKRWYHANTVPNTFTHSKGAHLFCLLCEMAVRTSFSVIAKTSLRIPQKWCIVII